MAGENILEDYLGTLRKQFYPDDSKAFFQQKSMLITAITTPARWLDERGVKVPDRRHREILDTIIKGIMHHGATGKIQYFCRYFLHAVQEHMSHNGERYYEEGKSLRTIVDTTFTHLTAKQRKRLPDAEDPTTTQLAALNRLVKSTRHKTKKQPASRAQMSLF